MIRKIKDEVLQLNFSEFGSCVYLIILKNSKIMIDTSSIENQQELLTDLNTLKIKPSEISTILLTHDHEDHTGNRRLFTNAKVYGAKNIRDFHSKGFKIIRTPGHTSDSLCFLYEDVLFSGDTLFCDGTGRTDFPESKPEKMQESLEKLRKIKYKILCPGHID